MCCEKNSADGPSPCRQDDSKTGFELMEGTESGGSSWTGLEWSRGTILRNKSQEAARKKVCLGDAHLA